MAPSLPWIVRILRTALVLVLILVPGTALAGRGRPDSPTLSRIVESGTLRVGMSGDQAPLNFRSRSGDIMGLEVELAGALARSMGVDLEVVQKDFPQLIDAVEAGDVDLVMSGMTITPERNLRVAFVGPYFLSGKSILTKSGLLARADEASDLDQASLTLAALRGSTSQFFVETLLPKATLVPTENYEQAVQKVLGDEVDALVADFPVCLLSVLRYPDAGLVALAEPLTVEPIGVALPPGDPLLANLVDNYLRALESTGFMERLRARWFQDSSWLTDLP